MHYKFEALPKNNKYFSQLGQDFLCEKFFVSNNVDSSKFFIEVGAYDGIKFSNTYLFEKIYNWNGICIEANLKMENSLRNNRKCVVELVAVSNLEDSTFIFGGSSTSMLSGLSKFYSKKHLKRIKIESRLHREELIFGEVKIKKLQHILDEQNVQNISFISIDTEGNELDVLQSINFNKVKIDLLIIENNYNTKKIRSYLKKLNYKLALSIEQDEFYCKAIHLEKLRDLAKLYFKKKKFLFVILNQLFIGTKGLLLFKKLLDKYF